MKTIMLLRHANASHSGSGQKDIERPLSKKGRTDAAQLGLFMKRLELAYGQVLSSPAQRAKQTVRHIMEVRGMDEQAVSWNDDLYYGGARDYIAVVQSASEDTNQILLVGHNPLLEETVSLLCDGEGAYLARIPQGGLICLEYPALEWNQVKPGAARFRWMVTPDLLHEINA